MLLVAMYQICHSFSDFETRASKRAQAQA